MNPLETFAAAMSRADAEPGAAPVAADWLPLMSSLPAVTRVTPA